MASAIKKDAAAVMPSRMRLQHFRAIVGCGAIAQRSAARESLPQAVDGSSAWTGHSLCCTKYL